MVLVMAKQKHRVKKKLSKLEVHQTQDDLEKYIAGGERGELPISHTGADISRPLNQMRLAEYHKCKDCQLKPVVFLQYKTAKGDKRCVGVCGRHWLELAPTVIGWNGE